MSDYRTALVEYISDNFAPEDMVLKNILEQQKNGGGPMMNIGPDQGKFLYLLVKLLKPKSILEIGSYYGYSAVWLARALSDGHLTCVEKSQKQCEIIEANLKAASLETKTNVMQASGIDAMQSFIQQEKFFDLIFIDADKKNYPNYFHNASMLLKQGGVLLVDNCIWDGRILDANPDEQTQAIKDFNLALAQSTDFDSTLLTIQDGLCMAIKN